jgi:hypothetical protein
MIKKNVFRSVAAAMLVILVASFTSAPIAKKFSPVGTWEYSIVDVPPEYQNGMMVITKTKGGLNVSMGPGGDYMSEAQDVVYKKKNLEFNLQVEYETITISGTFDKDAFEGTVSLSQGDFEISALRKVEE